MPWLMKSEPEDFSLEDLRKRPKQMEPWTGVRNYQARNFMRDEMKIGDKILFYHSNATPPGIAGIAEVATEAFPDPTAFDAKSKYFDPRAGAQGTAWMCVSVRYVETFPRLLPLEEMRRIPGLDSMLALKRGTRLSVQPVTAKEFNLVTEWMRKYPDAAPEDQKTSAAASKATPRGKRPG